MSQQPTESPAKQEGVLRATRVEWKSADSIPTVHANQVVVSNLGGEFYLTFGEVVPPVPPPTGEAAKDVVLKVNPLVRVAIAPGPMLEIAAAIQRNVQKAMERESHDD